MGRKYKARLQEKYIYSPNQPNSRVNREKRVEILTKRIRALEYKDLKTTDKRYKKLQDYKNELEDIKKKEKEGI